MSSPTNAKRTGQLDRYYTPDDVARKCVAVIADQLPGRLCLEPSAGGGAFMRAMRDRGAVVDAWDIDPEAPTVVEGVAECRDFMGPVLLAELFRVGDTGGILSRWDWIVGNPPYNAAQEHVERAIGLSEVGCAFLLRLAFLESDKRAPFWRAYPPAEVHILSRRPSFTGGGTDSATGGGTDSAAYAFFVWRRGFAGKTTMGWI